MKGKILRKMCHQLPVTVLPDLCDSYRSIQATKDMVAFLQNKEEHFHTRSVMGKLYFSSASDFCRFIWVHSCLFASVIKWGMETYYYLAPGKPNTRWAVLVGSEFPVTYGFAIKDRRWNKL